MRRRKENLKETSNMADKIAIALIMFYLIVGLAYFAQDEYWKGFYFLCGGLITFAAMML